MRIFASIAAVLLFLFLLTSVPAFSQQGGPDNPQDQQSKDKDAKNKNKDDAKSKDNAGRQDEKPRDESAPTERQPDNREHPEAAHPQEQPRPEGQAQPQERRDNHSAEGNTGRPVQGQSAQRIPEEKFRASFGREHHFHVERAHIVNQAQPEFVYGGYTFALSNPWPAEWSFDDDCYIDYVGDNYYLYDLDHPGIRILVLLIG
jgi:hypothetical protein